MKPSTSFLVVAILAVVLGSALASAGAIWQTRRTRHAQTLAHLQTGAKVEAALQTSSFDVLQLRARTLANDPAFVAYVTHALIPDPALGGAVDSLSISDLLSQRRHGYDVAVILDRQGHPVATSGVLLKEAASITHDALVTKALATGKPTQGMWESHGHLWWVSVNPLMRGGSLRALLLAATQVDNAFADAIAQITHTDIAIVTKGASGTPAARSTGLALWQTRALAATSQSLPDIRDGQGMPHLLKDAGNTTMAWITPLPDSQGQAALVAMPANAGAPPWVEPTAWPFLLGIAMLGLAGVFLVIIHWRRTCVPMDHIRSVIEHAADGDHHLHARSDGSAMVRQLRDAVNRLLQRDRT